MHMAAAAQQWGSRDLSASYYLSVMNVVKFTNEYFIIVSVASSL